MHEIRKQARERVKTRCRVCPVCNGKACAGEVPGMGGLGTGAAFQNSVEALARRRLVMRVLHGVSDPDTSCELWGKKLSLPVLAAPIGSVHNNLGSDLTEGEYSELVIGGCIKAGTLAGIGDTPLPEPFKQAIAQVGQRGKHVVPFIKPWALPEVVMRMDAIVAAGCTICGMDVDAAGLGPARTPPWAPLTPGRLADIVKEAHSRKLKFIAKGIMAADEAVIAADAGADAVLVSNHGGRVLDHTPGTADALPAIADAVGKRVVVMLDGGIRTGEDVLKALALGARITLICRPVAIAAYGGGADGVARYFGLIRDELYRTMRLTGCNTLEDAGPRILC